MNSNKLDLKLVLCIIACYLLFPANSFAQIETNTRHWSWGKTKDGRYAICHNVSFVNRDTVAVCTPQMNLDISSYPSIQSITITSLSGSEFDLNDIDSSPSGFSATNLIGNVIDPSTPKCVLPGRGVYFGFIVYSDPTVWGDNTSYAWSSTVTGVNPVEGNQTDTASDSSPEMYDSDIILGGALEVYQNGTPLGYNARLEPNIDGTYDFVYRTTIGNYDNDLKTGGQATNITYDDEYNHIYDFMPINSIVVSNSANGNLTINPNYNGGASTIGGSPVTPDDILITNGTLNPDQEDYVEITMNVGPIPLAEKYVNRWTTGHVFADDAAGNTIKSRTTDGTDPTQGNAEGPAVACRNGLAMAMDYRAYVEVTKEVTDALPAASGTAGNFDLSYEVTVLVDDDNDVNMYWFSAQDTIADAFGASFVGISSLPIVTNISATTPPVANSNYDGISGAGGEINLLSGSTYNFLEPGQSFRINYTVEVTNPGLQTELINNISVSGSNSLDQTITYQAASSYFLLKDNDSDGIRNDIDIDDDNDGILDTDESTDEFWSYISWSHNQADPYVADIASSKITDWGLSDVQNESAATGLSPVVSSMTLRIQDVDAKSLQESILNEEYIEYAFTTSNEIGDMTITRMFSSVYEEGTNMHGDSYKLGLLFSDDGFDTWSVLSSDIDHSDTNGASNPDRYIFYDGINNPPLVLKLNTTYEIRLQFYDVVDDDPAKNYIAFDDFLIELVALQLRNSDADGIPDHFDFDSDDDTCVDAIEAGHTDPDNDGILGNSPVSVASNGTVTGQGGYTGTNAKVTTPNTVVNFTTQPSDVTAFAGTNAFFSANVSDAGLTYQWEESLDEGSSWNAITDGGIYSGSTTGYLALSGVTGNLDTNDYRLVVSDSENPCGVSMISNSANLTVITLDSDNDTIPDPVDLDDDNDGILDSEEISDKLRSYQAPEGSRLSSYYVYQFNGNTEAVNFYREPQLLNWMFDSAPTDMLYNGITDVFGGAQKNLSDIDALTFTEAKSNGEYYQSTFTTGANLIDPYLRQVHIEWDSRDAGDDYSARLEVIVGGVVVYTSPEKRISPSTADFTSGTRGFYSVKSDLESEWLLLNDNTTYTVRTYVYDVDASSSTADYVIIDDATYRFSAALVRDTDGDLKPDHLDEDSDDDGCVDAIEAGHTDPDDDGFLGNSPVTVDGSGLVTGQGGYTGNHSRVITVNQTIAISTQPQDQEGNVGDTISFSAVVTGNSLTYQWEESTDGGTNFNVINNGGIYSGANTLTLTITGITATMQNNKYRVVVTDSNNLCDPDTNSGMANLDLLSLISITDATAVEGTNLTFTISTTRALSTDIIFDLNYTNTSTTNADYNRPTTVTLLANSTSVNFNVAAIDDSLIEPTEEFELVISSTSTASFDYADDEGIGTITDNDAVTGTGISFENDDITVDEAAGTATINVLLTGNVPGGFTLDFTSTDDTAVAPGDYTTNTGQLTFVGADGETQPVTISIIDDNLIEATERLFIDLSNLSTNLIGITDAQGNINITDNDGGGAGDGISVADFTVNENVGTTDFVITYTGPTVADAFTVDFTIADGTAVSPDDYSVVAATGNVSFPANTTTGSTQVVTVTIVDDALLEADENLNITLSNISTPLVAMIDADGVGTITDNDGGGAGDGISVADFTVNENVGTTDFVITYTGPTVADAFTVDFTITDGTAISPDDYSVVAATGNVSFPANTTTGSTQVVTVTIVDDALLEADENLNITLSNISTPLVAMIDADGVGTITDNDGGGAGDGISVADFTVNENVGTADFVITYTGPTVADAFTVDFTIADGTAVSPDDYSVVAATGNVSFPANTTTGSTQVVTVTIVDDALLEADENLNITLSNISTSLVAMIDADGVGTITDNDGGGAGDGISVADFTVNENVGTTDFVITYTGPTVADAFTVDFTITDGTAISPDDYSVVAATGNVSFPANTTTGSTQVVTVTIVDDALLEADENLNITLSNISTPLVAMIDADGVGTITDNDGGGAGDGISVADFTVNENVGTADFVITYTGPTVADAFTVDFTIADGTAVSPDDYSVVAATGNVSFPANTTTGSTQVVTVTIVDDALLEADENLNITLSNISTSLVAMIDADGVGTITDNDGGGAGDGISVADFTVNENVGTTDFVITYTGPTVADAFTVDFTMADGTAVSPDDYSVVAATGNVSFPANTTTGSTQVVTVTIVDDAILEASEDLNITLSNISTPLVAMIDADGVGTITDNDGGGAGDGISVADFTVNENVGTTDFVITYTGATVADAFTVDFTIADGTAVFPDDYSVVAATGNVSFPANTTTGSTQVVTVTIVDDAILEASEDLNITLSNISTPLVAMIDADGVGTITDNDGGGAGDGISVADFTVNENVGTADFVITYTGPTVADAFTVDFTIADGTAVSPDDYSVVAATGNVSFPANTTTGSTQVVTVTIVDDAILEASEDLNITLSNISTPLVAMIDADGVGTITDNDGGGAGDGISVADFTVNENVGTTDFVITYTGSTVADAFTVDYAIADGTAISPDDYTVALATGNVSFPANTTTGSTQVVTVTIVDDAILEASEDLNITLSNISTSLVAMIDADGVGTITDNEILDIDSDDDGIINVMEDLNLDADDDPATNPTDSDGDGHPDYLDIDSDNDGIPDNVEAQSTDEYIAPSLVDANNNGLDDAYESGAGLGLIPENTDGVDMPDYLDDDSDNDGVADAIEGNDHDHDGVPEVVLIGSDKDNDGLDDGFEGSEQIDIDVNDEIDNPINDLPNTDGDNESDYRDTDDDDDGIPTEDEDTDGDGDYTNDDFDNDGIPDYLDPDQPVEIDEVEVFNVVTPNGDGAHDYLIITGLDTRPNNNISIYNRWGILIYATESYDAATGNTFDGTSQGRATVSKGDRLPVGTYFYILNYEDLDGSNKSLNGHLYLN